MLTRAHFAVTSMKNLERKHLWHSCLQWTWSLKVTWCRPWARSSFHMVIPLTNRDLTPIPLQPPLHSLMYITHTHTNDKTTERNIQYRWIFTSIWSACKTFPRKKFTSVINIYGQLFLNKSWRQTGLHRGNAVNLHSAIFGCNLSWGDYDERGLLWIS